MSKVFGILLVGLTTVLLNSNSIGSVSVEEVIQKRIEMFKLSKANIKKLRKLIRSGDASKAVPLVDFHVRWSEDMPLLFPLGSEASTSNGSDASSDIWDNPVGFKDAIKQYNLKSKELRKSLRSADSASINETFKSFAGTCKGCHKQFRN
jgi:cytochrome c556